MSNSKEPEVKDKNVVRVPHMMLALNMRLRSNEHDGNVQTIKILIMGEKLKYEYRYNGFHPDPYFVRRIDREIDLKPVDMSDIIRAVKDYGLLKSVTINKPYSFTDEYFHQDLAIRLRDEHVLTKISCKTDQAGKEAKNILAFADYIRQAVTNSPLQK